MDRASSFQETCFAYYHIVPVWLLELRYFEYLDGSKMSLVECNESKGPCGNQNIPPRPSCQPVYHVVQPPNNCSCKHQCQNHTTKAHLKSKIIFENRLQKLLYCTANLWHWTPCRFQPDMQVNFCWQGFLFPSVVGFHYWFFEIGRGQSPYFWVLLCICDYVGYVTEFQNWPA